MWRYKNHHFPFDLKQQLAVIKQPIPLRLGLRPTLNQIHRMQMSIVQLLVLSSL